MGFILVDNARDDHTLQLGGWHWRTILTILETLAVLPKERVQEMGDYGACPVVSKDEAQKIAFALRTHVLSKLKADERIFIDGTVTNEPDDGTFFRSEKDMHRNYSTNSEAVESFSSFCESCDGFVVF